MNGGHRATLGSRLSLATLGLNPRSSDPVNEFMPPEPSLAPHLFQSLSMNLELTDHSNEVLHVHGKHFTD